MDEKTLKEILEQHKLWLESCADEGNRANLFRANLCNVNLSGTDLHYANLYEADFQYADLSGTDLHEADFFRAILYKANLSGADLRGANLHDTDLREANLSEADLRGASLLKADLRGVNLSGAINVPFIPMTCPDSGSFIGWKKASDCIVKLLIPEDAKRSSSTGRKCRTDKAVVLAIENIDGSTSEFKEVCSSYDSNFMYRIGETVMVNDFDKNRFNECSTGIHFFINRQEAVEY